MFIMTNTTEHFDGYALDDTLEGRLAQAAAVGVLTALPDYLSGKSLVAAYAAGFVGFGAVVAYTNAEAREDLDTDAQPVTEENDLGFALPALAVGLTAASVSLDSWVSRKFAGFLRTKGVSKPWTAMGALGAALAFGVSELEARDRAKRAADSQ